ncbi:MAG: hypothetical protein K2Y01_01675 [Rhabdochlamydiaceae bacterium]|nr:hypothetical protein [Rhabdochlamydiaceae bacterium]
MFKKTLVFLCVSLAIWASTPVVLEYPDVLHYAQEKLPCEGTLQMTQDGFLYVEVSKDYVFQLIPLLLKDKEVVCPPPYFGEGKVGAHITVAMGSEIGNRKDPIPYLGQKIAFSILRLEKVDLQESVLEAKTVYLLSVESSQIAEIRKKLGLSSKIRGHDFHITIAVDCP